MDYDALDRRLLDEFQDDFPLAPQPYAVIAERLGTTEDEVLARLTRLTQAGTISRVGAVFRPHTVGRSTLAAIAVPKDRLDAVAELVSAYPEVNHNYQRDHRLNLWFVVAACDEAKVGAVLTDIAAKTGLEVLDLPLIEDFHVNLGFGLKWN